MVRCAGCNVDRLTTYFTSYSDACEHAPHTCLVCFAATIPAAASESKGGESAVKSCCPQCHLKLSDARRDELLNILRWLVEPARVGPKPEVDTSCIEIVALTGDTVFVPLTDAGTTVCDVMCTLQAALGLDAMKQALYFNGAQIKVCCTCWLAWVPSVDCLALAVRAGAARVAAKW